MSTRRPRIKAVPSLAGRRKNTEQSVILKNNQPAKEATDKPLKSPQTPRATLISHEEEQKTPVIKIAPPAELGDSKESSSCANANTDSIDYKVHLPNEEPSKAETTPQRAAKVSVITPNLSYKPNTSNPSSDSYNIDDNIVSPIVRSPKVSSKPVGVIVQRPSTPVIGKTPASHTVGENNELQITSLNVNSVIYNRATSRNIVSDDETAPSMPEIVEDDVVMDGIVPLQAERNVPKPIDLLKNEIISENAEVLFDPIVPLPSPGKVRPKLRPTPRLGPLRRNSIQGSASESEEDSRRSHFGFNATPGQRRQRQDSQTSISTLNSVPIRKTNRIRNDSACSSVSQVAGATAAGSPVKEKTSKNSRRDISRRMATARRRRDTIKRETLTMYDLIFYNPTTNPIVPDEDEVKAKEDNARDELERKRREDKKKEEKKSQDKPETPAPDSAAPVPQIKLGPNGEIILDKSSLVISQTDALRDVSSTVREGAWGGGGGGGRYTRAARTAEWSASETVRFYRALAALGTDFTLMAPLFPDRTRRDLKVKFKKEERINGAQVDKALRMGNTWDPTRLREEFQDEREAAARKTKRQVEKMEEEKRKERERIQRSREVRVRNSRASKALQSTMLPGVSKITHEKLDTVDDIVNYALLKKAKAPDVPEEAPPPTVAAPSTPSMATLTLMNNGHTVHGQTRAIDMATISRVTTPDSTPQPMNLNALPSLSNVPSNIETGSLVVLTVNDPSSPSKKMLQTYIAHSAGRLTPVALPPTFLNSVVGYMKKGTPKSTVSSNSSPQLMSPCSVVSQDSRGSVATPGSSNATSPAKKKYKTSYTITQL